MQPKHLLAGFLFGITVLSGCATTGKKSESGLNPFQAFKQQSQSVNTVRGRAWISVKTPAQKASFPVTIAIDRTDRVKPKMRIEAIDLVGSAHVMIFVGPSRTYPIDSELTWIDLDESDVFHVHNQWFGIPVNLLPDLLIGLTPLIQEADAKQNASDAIEVQTKEWTYHYALEWINPGPRPVAKSLVAKSTGKSAKTNGLEFKVTQSEFRDYNEFYLPQKVEVKSTKNSKDQIDITLQWRERQWNETVNDAVFAIPSRFQR